MSGSRKHSDGSEGALVVSTAPPIYRLARRLFGPNANGEPLGIAIVSAPLFLLALWLSLFERLTVLGVLVSIYVSSVVVGSLVTEHQLEGPQGAPRSMLWGSLWD